MWQVCIKEKVLKEERAKKRVLIVLLLILQGPTQNALPPQNCSFASGRYFFTHIFFSLKPGTMNYLLV